MRFFDSLWSFSKTKKRQSKRKKMGGTDTPFKQIIATHVHPPSKTPELSPMSDTDYSSPDSIKSFGSMTSLKSKFSAEERATTTPRLNVSHMRRIVKGHKKSHKTKKHSPVVKSYSTRNYGKKMFK